MAPTDTEALAGRPITVVNHLRSEDSDGVPWELFVTDAELTEGVLRLAALGTLVALDPTLAEVLELEPGAWAEREGPTAPWDAYWAAR